MIKILIVDDSEIIRNLLSDYLNDNGYQVDTAVDGEEGIEKALNNDYDIVFCDVHMPKKNGYQVFKTVSSKKTPPAFIMTDSLPDNLAEKTIKAGAHTIITKPFDLEEVRITISRILGRVEENDGIQKS